MTEEGTDGGDIHIAIGSPMKSMFSRHEIRTADDGKSRQQYHSNNMMHFNSNKNLVVSQKQGSASRNTAHSSTAVNDRTQKSWGADLH